MALIHYCLLPSAMDLQTDNKIEDDDEEDDYMSNAFVQQTSTESVLLSRRAKLEQEKYKKKLENKVATKRELDKLQDDKRTQSLSKPINKDNMGFKLLEKMMLKSRTKKEEEKTTDQVESLMEKRPPIVINLKADRKGLGHQSIKVTPNLAYNANEALESRFEANEPQFRANKRAKTERYLVDKDLRKCRKVCYNLDQQAKGKDAEPFKVWYWPERETQTPEESSVVEVESENKTEEEKDEDQIEDGERLKEMNNYLRDTYQYCVWCAIRFDSAQDLAANCPGDTRAHHDLV